MSCNYLVHADKARSDRSISPMLWADCTVMRPGAMHSLGHRVFNDFIGGPLYPTNTGAATTVVSFDSIVCETSNGPTITPVANGFSLVRLAVTNTDNLHAHLQFGAEVADGGWLRLDNADGPIWFEARFRVSDFDTGNVFVGLGLPNLCGAAESLSDTADAFANGFLGIGFRKNADGTLDFVYKNATGAATEVVVIDTLTTMADSTFVKVGFKYRPGLGEKALAVFLNGVEQTTYLSDADVDGLTTLAGDTLVPLAICKATTTTAINLDIDWIGAAQSEDI